MPKMSKEQRELVSKLVCQEAAAVINKKYGGVLKKFEATVGHTGTYRSPIYHVGIRLSGDEGVATKIRKEHTSKAIRNGAYKISVSAGGYPTVTLHESVNKGIAAVMKPIRAIEDKVREFNNKMDTEFMLTTSFDGVDDISQFIKDFTAGIK